MTSFPARSLEHRPKNRLLQSLPEDEFDRLQPDLQTIPIAPRHVFFRAGQPLDYVYFPNGGVASVTTVLSDGRMVETATVGAEGMLGIEAMLSADAVAQGEVLLQVSDTDAARLSVSDFRRELEKKGVFADLIGRYAIAVLRQMMHSTACNALHQVHERCARWLLMTHDRVGNDSFHLSHEFLGVMLGVRRQSVTVVAGALQAAGLITYHRGDIRVLDREGLEGASCECYGLISREFEKLSL